MRQELLSQMTEILVRHLETMPPDDRANASPLSVRRSPLRLLARSHLCVKLARLLLGNRQRSPVASRKMPRQKNNLPYMIRIMCNLPVDGLCHRMRLGANSDQIGRASCRERV